MGNAKGLDGEGGGDGFQREKILKIPQKAQDRKGMDFRDMGGPVGVQDRGELVLWSVCLWKGGSRGSTQAEA